MPYFGDVEEVGFGGGLIPEGAVVMCALVFDKNKRESNGKSGKNGFYNVAFEVCEGQYAGSKFFENIAVDGAEGYFLQKGKTAIRYILETTRKAHEDPMQYNVGSITELNGSKVVVQVGIEVKTKQDGTQFLGNYAKAYGTPRQTSRNYKYYQAWENKEQPWQTDEKPVISNNKPRAVANSNDMHPNHPDYQVAL